MAREQTNIHKFIAQAVAEASRTAYKPWLQMEMKEHKILDPQ